MNANRRDSLELETEATYLCLEVTINYDAEEGEPMTYDYPGSSAYIAFCSVRVDSVVGQGVEQVERKDMTPAMRSIFDRMAKDHVEYNWDEYEELIGEELAERY